LLAASLTRWKPKTFVTRREMTLVSNAWKDVPAAKTVRMAAKIATRRLARKSAVMGDSGQSYNQLFHIAGYGKVTVNGGSLINGRMVEKWYINDGANGNDFAAVQRQESSPVLFNYVSPEAFIISETWYNTYCMQPLPKPNNDQ